MSDSNEPVSSSDVTETPQLPPLRIHHLLTLTAVAAVLLAYQGVGYRNSTGSQLPDRFWIVLGISSILLSLLTAVALTVVVYGLAWRRQGIRFFYEPGHWLLVAISLSCMLDTLLSALATALVTHNSFVFWSTRIPAAGAIIYIARTQCTELRWIYVLWNKALAQVVPIFGDMAIIIKTKQALNTDMRTFVHRDVLHWCGVMVQLSISALMIVSLLTMFLLVVWR